MLSLTRASTVRRVLIPATLAVAVLVAACRGDNSASTGLKSPEQASQQLLGLAMAASQQPMPAQGLTWSTPRPTRASVTKVVGAAGGTISLPGTGLQLQVPAGALTANVTFTITALAGKVVAYDFQPHGAVFNVPLTFVQDLGTTAYRGVKLPPNFVPAWQGGYFADSLSINETTGVTAVTEFIAAAADLTVSSTRHAQVSFLIRHFSGYIISVGRDEE